MLKSKAINLTRDTLTVAGVVYPPSGIVAEINLGYTQIVGGVCTLAIGGVLNIPDREVGVVYIVSELVSFVLKGKRSDVVAPAATHPDVQRNAFGDIIHIPCFYRYYGDTYGNI